ncbi:MAG: hypothetical protein V1772_01700 [Chloroflexota bacterium]
MTTALQILVALLVLLLIYMAVGGDVTRVARRRGQGLWAQYGQFIRRSVVVPALVFLALGLLMRDLLLTPFLLAVAGAVAYYRIRQVIAALNTITPRQVSHLVLAFRANYQIQPAAFKSLEVTAGKIGEPLSSVLRTTVGTYQITQSSARAFDAFRERVHNPALHQFIYILEMSESATNESVTQAIDMLIQRLRRQEELQRQVETGMSSITGQTNFMQMLAVAIGFVVALVPGFRAVYTSGLLPRVGYMALVGVIVAGSYYIDQQILSLKAQIL